MPRAEISINGYAHILDALLGELGIDAATVVGNSMGGFIGAELAISFPERAERLVLVSAAGLSTYNDPRTTRTMPALRRAERLAAASAAWLATRSDAVTRRPRLREAVMKVAAHHPGRLPGPLVAEQVRGAGKPGFIPALQAIVDYEGGATGSFYHSFRRANAAEHQSITYGWDWATATLRGWITLNLVLDAWVDDDGLAAQRMTGQAILGCQPVRSSMLFPSASISRMTDSSSIVVMWPLSKTILPSIKTVSTL